MISVEKPIYEFYKNEKLKLGVKIGSRIREEIGKFLRARNFIEIPPVVISPVTDPLAHEIVEAKIEYYKNEYYLTTSMIFHKQIALLSFDKIFSFSPNIRLETEDKIRRGRHLIEFTQVDVEMRNAKREDVMKIAEKMIVYVMKKIKDEEDIEKLERELKIPSLPFEKIPFEEAYSEYGENYEEILSHEIEEPVWIVDFPAWKREFYDREYEARSGWLVDMDLIYPEGFGEALSGGEREYEYDKIIRRMKEKRMDISRYKNYLMMAKIGLHPSAGFGIGIERLTRYICGFREIKYVNLFPKLPGQHAYF